VIDFSYRGLLRLCREAKVGLVEQLNRSQMAKLLKVRILNTTVELFRFLQNKAAEAGLPEDVRQSTDYVVLMKALKLTKDVSITRAIKKGLTFQDIPLWAEEDAVWEGPRRNQVRAERDKEMVPSSSRTGAPLPSRSLHGNLPRQAPSSRPREGASYRVWPP